MLREIPSYATALVHDGVLTARAQGHLPPLQALIKSARQRAIDEVRSAQAQVTSLREQAWQEGYCDGFAAVIAALVPALATQIAQEHGVLERVLQQVHGQVGRILQDGTVHTALIEQAHAQTPVDQGWTIYLPADLEHLATALQARLPPPLTVMRGEAAYPVMRCGDRVIEIDPASGLMASAQAQAISQLSPEVLHGWADEFIKRARQQITRQTGLAALNLEESLDDDQ